MARELVRELVFDLLWLNSITLSRSYTWSQTWFSTCRRQVRAILLCDQRASWLQTCSRAGRKLDSVMEFGRDSRTGLAQTSCSELESVLEFFGAVCDFV